MSEDLETSTPASPEVVARLVAAHREFLAFLEARLPSRAAAEEVLQAAFARTLERGGAIRDTESAVAWFYRLLRNALTDYYRRRGAEARALEQHAKESQTVDEQALQATVCGCMKALLPNLKPEYAELLQRVDLQEQPIGQIAAELSITPNNAGVRLHRARQALKRELERSCGTCAAHGCLDCTCSDAPGL
jgi:RNA polymerase sigma-70 factor (ECF subfamily)